MRRERRRARTPAPLLPLVADDGGTSFDGALVAALARLRHDHRVAVVLVHCFGHTYREVGEVLGVSDAAVTNFVHRGLHRLRRELGVTL